MNSTFIILNTITLVKFEFELPIGVIGVVFVDAGDVVVDVLAVVVAKVDVVLVVVGVVTVVAVVELVPLFTK